MTFPLLLAVLLGQVVVAPKPTGQVRVLCTTAVAATAAADTNENALATCTVPANVLGANGTLRIWSTWTVTNSANNKTLRVRYSGIGGTAYMVVVLTTSVSAQYAVLLSNRGATNAQIGAMTGGGLAASSGAHSTSTVDTTADTTIVVTCQKASGAEACTLERYLVELITP